MSLPPNTVVSLAYAKVNPFLRVLGRRPDGYHDLETLVVPISLADRLEIHASAGEEFRTLSLSLEVTGDQTLTRAVPRDESNLVIRAAVRLAEHAGVRGFADVLLEKHVPAAAGLGGGSSDAAATIRALDSLWGCGLADEELLAIAADVGSDVPALLTGAPCLVAGRGERVERVETAPLRWALVPFGFGVSTRDAFGWWDDDRCEPGPDPAPLLEAMGAGDAPAVGGLLSNDLEAPVVRRHPQIREAKDRLLRAGALGAVMCGSGPTIAALLPDDRSLGFPGAIDVVSL